MSLMSYITSNNSQAGYGSSLSGLPGATATSATTTKTGTTSSTAATNGNSASISTAAKIAAAEAADNKKDFTTLSADVRSALDAVAKAAKDAGKPTGKPDLSEMSGRALSAIILNKTGAFTGAEQATAKAELRTRTRDDLSAATTSGNTLTALTSYNQLLISEYDAISPEEREARGWTSAIRSSAANFVSATTASASGANSSLFDLLNGDDDDSGSTSPF